MDVSRAFHEYPTVEELRAARDRWALYATALRSDGLTERASNIEALVMRATTEVIRRRLQGSTHA